MSPTRPQTQLEIAQEHILSGISTTNKIESMIHAASNMSADQRAGFELNITAAIAESTGILSSNLASLALGMKTGYKGMFTLPSNKKGSKNEKFLSRLSGKGNTIFYTDRPTDTLTDANSANRLGYTINDFISQVIPFLEVQQKGRSGNGWHSKCVSTTVFGPKGGSKKTSTTSILGTTSAMTGSRVLFIDLDPQATLSSIYGYPLAAANLSSNGDVFDMIVDFVGDDSHIPNEDFDISTFTYNTIHENVDIVRGSSRTVQLDALLDSRERIDKFHTLLDTIKRTNLYDLIIIDTRPASNHLDLNTALSSDIVLIANPASIVGNLATYQTLASMNSYAREMGFKKMPMARSMMTDVNQSMIHNASNTIKNGYLNLDSNKSVGINSTISFSNIFGKAELEGITPLDMGKHSSSSKGYKTLFEESLALVRELHDKCISKYWYDLDGDTIELGQLEDAITLVNEGPYNSVLLNGAPLTSAQLGLDNEGPVVQVGDSYVALKYQLPKINLHALRQEKNNG